MLIKDQLNQISQDFHIDTFTIFREYLQLVFLNYLYQEKESEKIYFKGGTCLHFLYSSPRFSEDLDFSTTLSKKTLKEFLTRIIQKMQKEIPQIMLIFVWQGKKSLRYRLKYQGEEIKYPLIIRLDFAFEKIFLEPNISKIGTKIPISFSPLVLYLKEEELLAEKMRAFLFRAKGRDIFDLWYLLDKKVFLNEEILKKKLKQVNLSFEPARFLEKITNYPSQKLEKDLAKFLPRAWRKIIPLLKEKVLKENVIKNEN